MKILFSLQYFYPPVGGGELSLRRLAEKLAEDHEIGVLYAGKGNEDFERFGLKLRSRKLKSLGTLRWINELYQLEQWSRILEDEFKEIKPDLILTQLNFSPPTIRIAKKYNIPSVLFIRSYEHFCPKGFIDGTDCNKKCWNCLGYIGKLQYLFFKRIMNEHKKALQNADILIANSRYTADIAKEWYNVNAMVVYPFIESEQYKVDRTEPNYILFIGRGKEGGIELLLKIAGELKNKEFLVVGMHSEDVQSEIKNYENIKYFGWTDDMCQVYSQTMIHIAPRIWPEPFGRVCIEAGINGIPTIASNIGGLPESVGDGGILIDDFYKIDKWVKAIQSLDDEALYNKLSENAKRHAQKFDFENTFKDFKEAVKRKLGIAL